LSTVVGAVFMILVTIGALNAILWTIQQQNSVTESIIEKSNANLDKLNESIDISNVRIDGNKLNMTVSNQGGAAATLKSIYIVNETAGEQYRYDLDLIVDGRESLKDVGQSLPLVVEDDTRYSVRLITESGNTVATTLTPLSSVALPMSLYIIPPTFTPGENVTVLYTVTNNLTDSELSEPIELNLSYTVDCSPLGTANCDVTKHVQPPSNITTIAKGNTALFKWVFEAQVPDEDYITFNASLTNAKEGNYVVEKGLSKLVDASKTSFTTEIIINSGLVQKPEIFLMLPNPFGDSASRGLWGVIVANPTETNMTVSRIVLNMYTSKPTGGGGAEFINGGCSVTQIFPSSGWSCPHANMIEWKNIADPEQITGLEAQSFLARIQPDDLTEDESAYTVSVAVFTNMGQFTKTGYSAGMADSTLPLASVYMTNTIVEADADDDNRIFGNMSNLTPEEPATFHVAVADLDSSTSTHIDAGTELIVNVPKGFSDIDITSSVGFSSTEIIPYADGSTQIVAVLGEEVGNTASEVKVLRFDATPPSVDPAGKRVYIMHTLLNGLADGGTNDFSVGALAEFALQVDE
jgi:hypothetical protein